VVSKFNNNGKVKLHDNPIHPGHAFMKQHCPRTDEEKERSKMWTVRKYSMKLS